MSADQQSSSPFVNDLQHALILCSQELDASATSDDKSPRNMLSSKERALLTAYRQQPELSSRIEAFTQQTVELRGLLKMLPVKPTGSEFAVEVRRRIQEIQKQSPADGGPATSGTEEPGSIHDGVKVTICRENADAFAFGTVHRHMRSSATTRATVCLSTLALAMLVVLMLQRPDATPTLASRSLPLGTSASAGVLTGDELTVGTEAEQLLVDSEQLRIFAVKIASADSQDVRDQIRAILDEAGLKMMVSPMSVSQETNRFSHSDGFGVLLTAAPSNVNALLAGVRHSSLVRSAEWDPDRVADMDRQQLIDAVLHSMQSPTRSELHFGEVFLAVPANASQNEQNVIAEQEMLAISRLGHPGLDQDLASPNVPNSPDINPELRSKTPAGSRIAAAGQNADSKKSSSSGVTARSPQPATAQQNSGTAIAGDLPFVLVVFQFDASENPSDCVL